MKRFTRLLTVAALLVVFLSCSKKSTEPPVPTLLEPIVKEETAVLTTTQQNAIVSFNDSLLVMDAASGAAFAEGDVIVSEPNELAPNGILRKVAGVKIRGNDTVITTENATLEDVFDQAEIDDTRDVLTTEIESSQSLCPGAVFVRDAKDASKFTINLNQSISCGNISLSTEGSTEFTLNFNTKFKVTLWDGFKSCSFKAIATVKNDLKITAEASFDTTKTIPLYEYKFKPFTVWVGVVPVVFVPKLNVDLEITAKCQGNIVVRIERELAITGGIKYDKSDSPRFSIIAPSPTLTGTIHDPTSSAGASVSAEVGPKLEMKLYGVAGPHASITGTLEFKVGTDLLPVGWQLQFIVKGLAGIKFDKLGIELKKELVFYDKPLWTFPTPTVCATPVFSPPGGNYTSTQSVRITCATSEATIRYNKNSSTDPTASDLLYTGPISVASTTTIKAKAFKSGLTTSALGTATYTVNNMQTVATPTFNPPPSVFTSPQTISISCTTPGAYFWYTTDGTEPVSDVELAQPYEIPIPISSTTTLKAKAFKDGWLPSATQTGTYTINIQNTILINDSFENYAIGSFPTSGGWYLRYEGMGASYQTISDQQHWSGSKSLQVRGDYSLRAEILRPINVSASDIIVYEASFYGSANDNGGHCQLFNPDEGMEGTNIHEVLFHNYTITVDGVSYGSYNNNEWNHIRVKYNQQNHTISMWLNTALIIDNLSFTPKTFPITHFSITTQYGYQTQSYWDDIKLWVEGKKSKTTVKQVSTRM